MNISIRLRFYMNKFNLDSKQKKIFLLLEDKY
jgi:hypothetical protein